MLVYSVYDFFPNKIKVSWLRDGQEVNSDVTSTEVMPNGDWYYQTHSHLEYKPRWVHIKAEFGSRSIFRSSSVSGLWISDVCLEGLGRRSPVWWSTSAWVNLWSLTGVNICLSVHTNMHLTTHLSVILLASVCHLSDSEPSSDKSTSESTTLTATGASILTLGLILILVGYIFYRWKARGQTRTHTHRPVNSTSYQSC